MIFPGFFCDKVCDLSLWQKVENDVGGNQGTFGTGFPPTSPSRARRRFDYRPLDRRQGLACGFPSVPHGQGHSGSRLGNDLTVG